MEIIVLEWIKLRMSQSPADRANASSNGDAQQQQRFSSHCVCFSASVACFPKDALFTLPESIDGLSIERVSKSPALFLRSTISSNGLHILPKEILAHHSHIGEH